MKQLERYEPVMPKEMTLFEMSPSEIECSSLMELHLKLSEMRDKYDFSVPLSVTLPFKCSIPEGVAKFNEKACSFVSVDEWLAEKLEREGVFPSCVVIDLSMYGNLPLVLYDILKVVSVAECKDVLVGLPVWVMEGSNEDKA